MVGFPGETDDDFRETYELINASPLTYLHVFPYSSRPGTVAAVLPNQVPDHVARFRAKSLRDLIARKNETFRRNMVGQELDVLTLEEGTGISSNFLRVSCPGVFTGEQVDPGGNPGPYARRSSGYPAWQRLKQPATYNLALATSTCFVTTNSATAGATRSSNSSTYSSNEFAVARLSHTVPCQLRRKNGSGDIMIPDIFSFFLRRKI